MQRREFLRLCAVLGVTAPLTACGIDGLWSDDEPAEWDDPDAPPPDRSVIVIGAGAAGMSAGHMLARRGADFRILEAAPTHGGRIKTLHGFVDFPIPLGGEWLHEAPSELDEIVADADVEVTTRLAGYGAGATTGYYDGVLTVEDGSDDEDLKLVGETWLTFFDTYIVPGIAEHMTFDTQIVHVDHRGDTVVLTDAAGGTHEADRVIVTVPLRVLRDEEITFDPPLSTDRRDALDTAPLWGGMKVFVEFAERFYPSALALEDSATPEGQRLYYDAAWGQDTEHHVLGLFSVGAQAAPYQALDQGDELRDHVLAELDEIFDGQASPAYIQHVAQNWSEEPFIGQAYLADDADWRLPGRLAESIDGRVLFAGDAYTTHGDWSAVDDAARSGRAAAVDALS